MSGSPPEAGAGAGSVPAGVVAAVETGGTTCAVAVGHADGRILAQETFPTTTPDELVARCLAFVNAQRAAGLMPAALGLAAFGPLDVDPASPRRGTVLRTPKAGWEDAPLGPALGDALALPWAVTTDVGAAALAEARLGAGRGADPVAYVTVGTGVGAGLVVGGRIVQGRTHPEMGHVALARLPGDTRPSACPFHADCLEGLASGPAVAAAFGDPARLPDGHPIWEIVATYLGRALATLVLVAAPARIVLGGGVGSRAVVRTRSREHCRRALGGYLQALEGAEAIARLIVPPALEAPSGLVGALLLAGGVSAAAEPPPLPAPPPAAGA